VLEGRDRKGRKKLFKAIENGQFDDFDLMGLDDPQPKSSRE
jgi:nitrogen fixation-related uncharacterized protein